jgi:hypothetical protein
VFQIKKILNYFFKDQETDNTINILTEDKDIIIVSTLFDCQTNNMICAIDAKPHKSDDPRMAQQAECLGHLLNKICRNNVELTELMINNIEILKKKSYDHLLFYNNVLFFWKHLIENEKKSIKEDAPVVRPTQVFKN